MEKYAFYTYTFVKGSTQQDLFQPGQPAFENMTLDGCRSLTDNLMGRNGDEFVIQRHKKYDGETYPCTVMAHTDGITLLRIERPKKVPIYEKSQVSDGGIANIVKRPMPSNPYNYVIIDCRAGHNLIAISMDSDAWNNTDTVGNMLQTSINRQLDLLSRGFNIRLTPQYLQRNFVEYSRFLIKKKKRRVSKMTFFFTGGSINPEIEAIIKSDSYLRALESKRFKAKHCEVSYIDPDSASLIRKNSSVLEHFVALVMSQPKGDAYRLSMTYDDGTTLNCGKSARFIYQMSDSTFLTFWNYGTLFDSTGVGGWLDHVVALMEEEQNAGEVQ